jgi:hypothetical protein
LWKGEFIQAAVPPEVLIRVSGLGVIRRGRALHPLKTEFRVKDVLGKFYG